METAIAAQAAAGAIAGLSQAAVRKIFSAASGKVRELRREAEIELGLTFRSYLTYAWENNSRIKTLLYRHTPRYLYDFYECIGLLCHNRVVDPSDVNNLLDAGHRLLVTGTGGSGKSMMMRHLFLNTVERTDLVPLLVELRGLNNREYRGIQEYLRHALAQQRLRFEREEYFTYSLEAGCYVFLLDGYDEVRGDLAARVGEDIQDLSCRFPDNWYILSSRPLPEFVGWKNFRELRALSMTRAQALRLIRKLDYDPPVRDRFCRELEAGLYEKQKTFASNPLLLTIMLMTFGNCATIPDTLNEFYEQAFHTLFREHDATKGTYRRDIFSKLGYDDFKAVFACFCFKSFFESQFQFTAPQALDYIAAARDRVRLRQPLDSEAYLRDLTESVCMLVREGLQYRFAHRSFQEYFAAVYTNQLSDRQQRELLLAWTENRGYRRSTRYLDMLCELAPARFEQNYLIHVLREMRERAAALGGPYSGVRLIFSALELRLEDETWTDWETLLTLEAPHYLDAVKWACRLGQYVPPEESPEELRQEKEAARWLLDAYPPLESDPLSVWVPFQMLEEAGALERVRPLVLWQERRFRWVMDYLAGLEREPVSQPRRFSELLRDL